MRKWRTLARHGNWVHGCKITESIEIDGNKRRFVATINGWRNWFIWEGIPSETPGYVENIVSEVRSIKSRIESGDEVVFGEKKYDRQAKSNE